MNCPHESWAKGFFASDPVTGQGFQVQTCAECGLALTRPIPVDLDPYYPAAYYGEPGRLRFPGPVEWLQSRLYRARARRVQRHKKSLSSWVLDIGCGKGFQLRAFQALGWEVQGLERSDHAARHGREVLGLDIRVGDLMTLEGGPFGAIVLWHVLEHLPDPGEILRRVHGLLEPGGILLVSVPNFGSPEARLTRDGWFHLDVPRHLIHFSHGTLGRYLRESGFECVDSLRFAPEYDLFSFIQSIQNWMGLPQNLLYRMLRAQGAKLPGGSVGWLSRTLALVSAVPLACLGVPCVLLLGTLSQGSTVTYLVRRLPEHQA